MNLGFPALLGKIAHRLLDNSGSNVRLSLNNEQVFRMLRPMTRFLAVLLCLALPSLAVAECYADYKAKKDNPLRLHYGVVSVPDNACTPNAASRIVANRIAGDGWTLLTVVSVFGPEGLQQREGSAGQYFLRY